MTKAQHEAELPGLERLIQNLVKVLVGIARGHHRKAKISIEDVGGWDEKFWNGVPQVQRLYDIQKRLWQIRHRLHHYVRPFQEFVQRSRRTVEEMKTNKFDGKSGENRAEKRAEK